MPDVSLVQTGCVMAEVEKLGQKYQGALRITKDPGFEQHAHSKGAYADDCLLQRVTPHKCYIVAWVDLNLKLESGRSLGSHHVHF